VTRRFADLHILLPTCGNSLNAFSEQMASDGVLKVGTQHCACPRSIVADDG